MDEARRPLGDRIEGALDQRADVEGEIARGERSRPTRRTLLRAAAWLTLTGVSLYLVAPALLDTLSSWRDVTRLDAAWMAALLGLEAISTVCLWWLQRIAMRPARWFAVATSQLASNGLAKVAPGGGAVGAALQYRLLAQAGVDGPRAISGLTATNLMTLAIVLALPVLAIPSLIRGVVDRNLAEAAVAGFAIFAVLAGLGAAALMWDGPLRWVGRTVQRVRNRLRPHAEPLHGLPSRLLRERDRILRAVGDRWLAALVAGTGRWAFDYAGLLAALAAVGATPRPSLVLLAFCTAQLLAQLPFTPGGLGFVEAGLTATLTLAGVHSGDAVLATFAYRLATYWLPMPLGLLGMALHRQRYRGVAPAAAT
jgi:uncharacterized membrane protein YbhN (UPF0104 family)